MCEQPLYIFSETGESFGKIQQFYLEAALQM